MATGGSRAPAAGCARPVAADAPGGHRGAGRGWDGVGAAAPTAEERAAAADRVDASGVMPALERALNEACRSNARDLVGFVVASLRKDCAGALLSSVKVSMTSASDGGRAVLVEVHADHHGQVDLCGAFTVGVEPLAPELASAAAATAEDFSAAAAAETSCTQQLSTALTDALAGLDPGDTVEIDKAINVALPSEPDAITSAAHLATSLAVSVAAASAYTQPLHSTIAVCTKAQSSKISLPAITAIAPAAAGGKCKVKEIWVAPPAVLDVAHHATYLQRFHAALSGAAAKSMATAANPRLVGGFVPPKIDKLEQALELVREAASAVFKAAPPQVIVDVGASTLWNGSKGKYEVIAGQQKSPSDALKDWVALIKARPEIVALIDPLLADHADELASLRNLLAEDGHCVFTEAASSAGVDTTSEPVENECGVQSTRIGIVVRPGRCSSLTEARDFAAAAHSAGATVCYSAVSEGRLLDEFAPDFGTGLGARFTHIGPLNPTAIRRFAQIQRELIQ